ncbi:recombinase family protein [Henriciella sp.]|uniref:recombinase family protein n=1 Tax=Henriciella sp. TaxID=1968823 RepID=UPI002631E22D|nr:recombinase family protein [Henriciella sp.]
MKTCFGYVRVSTVKQGDGVSLEAQKEAILGFASRNNITVSRWFDEKVTAAKRGRPVFNRMVSELKRHKADGVIFHKIDRSARNFADWARIGDLAEAGIDIHFATESLDFRSRGGRLTADIQAVIAADYIRNLREETIKGIEGRLKQGLYPFKAPIGYLDNGRGRPKTIDPVKGHLVRQLFELYASGQYSLYSLTDEAARIGLRNNWGRPLAKTGIEKILRNPFYVGLMTVPSSGRTYKGVHEPLVSVSLFDDVTAVREGRDNKKSTKHNHVFRGLFRCALCDGAMIPERQKGKVYYRCHERNCATKTIREDRLEAELVQSLKRVKLSETEADKLKALFQDWLDRKRVEDDTDRAEFELMKIQERLSRLTDMLIDGVIDEEAFQKKRAAIMLDEQRWQEIAARKADNDRNIAVLDKFLERAKSLVSLYQMADPAMKRELAVFATSNRAVSPGTVEIEPSIEFAGARKALETQDVTFIDPLLELRPMKRRLTKADGQQEAA